MGHSLFILLSMNIRPEPAVQSIQRAADILKCISDRITSVTDIAFQCNLSKATVHRLLKALCEAELAIQNPVSHQYFLGPQFIKLTLTPSTSHEYLIDCAKKEMQSLSEITGETIDLRIKLGLKNIGLNLIQSKNDLMIPSPSFQVRSLSGEVDDKALLTQLTDEEVSSIYGNMQTGPLIKRKYVDIQSLRTSLNAIRTQGYAVSSNELIMGFTCICAPVKNYLLPVVLLVTGPETRMKTKLGDMTQDVVNAAACISANLLRCQSA
jgi:IclR family transcriptional regulator, KDG regulon repressor